MRADISLQTKQILSQAQVESLNILSMSVVELQEFLQKEEIENPIVEYSEGRREGDVPITFRECGWLSGGAPYGKKDGDGKGIFYQAETENTSVEELVISQLPWGHMTRDEKRIAGLCIESLEENGYLLLSEEEIADALGVSLELTGKVLSELKKLEPKGIFASDLSECLCLQTEGLPQEEELKKLINDHLPDVAEGRISSISRAMKLSSVEVRRLIHVLRTLNPRPLNGYGSGTIQYIVPDVLLQFSDGQWTASLNDKWTGSFGINEFYVHMMETAQDEQLKAYFEEKLRRARFIMNAVEQRRKTLLGITEAMVARQAGYFSGKGALRPMTLEEIAGDRGIHKSTVSRAIKDKYILTPAGCFLIRSLFTAGIGGKYPEESGGISRSTVKEKLKALVEAEDKAHPYSDEQLSGLLSEAGMTVSRRTVAKYRMELMIGSAFQRRNR